MYELSYPARASTMLSRSQAFAAAFSAKKALLNVNATVNAERTFTFIPSMVTTPHKQVRASRAPRFGGVALYIEW